MSARDDLVHLAERARRGEVLGHIDPRWEGRRIDPDTARRAAVLLLFGVLDTVDAASDTTMVPANLDVLLIERAGSLEDHPGQVAFPGGGIDDADGGPVDAAVREAVEETGLKAVGVDVLGSLPEVGLPVSNFMVTPVLAWWAAPSPVDVVDYGESAAVFRVPVRDLLDPRNRHTATAGTGVFAHRGPAFDVDGVLVWGFTAMVLNQLFDQLGWTLDWDRRHLRPVPGY